MLKPKDLIISDLKWKYLLRSVLRAKNILIVGPTGCAKTMAARCVSTSLKRPISIFNLGSTQDARATLIGNTTYKKESGTVFHKSPFVKAITTPNTLILLDELSRASHDAHNILMPVIDPTQRSLRLDEDEDGAVIKVAEGVTFVATANIGNEYTATKVLDKAMARRFPVKLEMFPLSQEELGKLIFILYPDMDMFQRELMGTLIQIYDDLISQCKLEDAKITTYIPPANMVEIAELVIDGFSLEEIAECAIYTEYPEDGGVESERTFVKSIVQAKLKSTSKSPFNDPLKK